MNYKIENGIAGPITIFRDGLKRENYFNIPSNIFNIIKDLQKENQQLKEQLEASEKARKEALELLEKSYDFIDEDYNKDLIDIYELINKLSLDIDKGK